MGKKDGVGFCLIVCFVLYAKKVVNMEITQTVPAWNHARHAPTYNEFVNGKMKTNRITIRGVKMDLSFPEQEENDLVKVYYKLPKVKRDALSEMGRFHFIIGDTFFTKVNKKSQFYSIISFEEVGKATGVLYVQKN